MPSLVDSAAPSPSSPVATMPPSVAVPEATGSAPPRPPETDGFEVKKAKVPPPPPEPGTVEHRAVLVNAALRVVADARSMPQDPDVVARAMQQFMDIGLCETPLIAAYQKPRVMRTPAEAKPATPVSSWKLADWAGHVVQGLVNAARQSNDSTQRVAALETLSDLMEIYKSSHPKFVEGQIPALRELALNGPKDVWHRAVGLLQTVNDVDLIVDLMTMVVERKSLRAAEILTQIKPALILDLLRHKNADVRQLSTRLANPADLKKVLTAEDEAVRLSIMQGLHLKPVMKGADYSEYVNLLLGVLSEDTNHLVVAEAGRALVHLDNRLPISHLVRLMPDLRGTDPKKAAAAAGGLLRLDLGDAFKASLRAIVRRVAEDEKTLPDVRVAVAAALQPHAAKPAQQVRAPAPVRVAPVPSAAVPARPSVPSEWALRSAAFIETGGLMVVLNSSNMHQLFFAIQTINRAWTELTHLRSAPVAENLMRVAGELPADQLVYQPMRNYMMAWALRLDPRGVAPRVLQMLQGSDASKFMKTAAVYALSQAPADGVGTRHPRFWVINEFLTSDSFDYDVLTVLQDFSDLVMPRLAEFIQKIPKENYARKRFLSVLDAMVKTHGDAFAQELQDAAAGLGVSDLDILTRLGAAGVTRMAELVEDAALGLEDRQRVVDVLVERGEAAHPELVDLLTSEDADARMLATLALVWTEEVSVADFEKMLTEATEVQWRHLVPALFEDTRGYVKSRVHVLKEVAYQSGCLEKQVALARLMARFQSDASAAPYQNELATQYFKVVLVDHYFSSSSHTIKLMVALLPYDALRSLAEQYLRKHSWKAVVALNDAWQTTTDAAHRQIIEAILISLGDELVEKILSDRISRDDALTHRDAMQLLAPRIRNVLLQRAANNPRAAIAWAERMGHEGAAFLELMSQLDNPKLRKMAQRASGKMGDAFLEDAASEAGIARRAAETPEAAFRVLEGYRK